MSLKSAYLMESFFLLNKFRHNLNNVSIKYTVIIKPIVGKSILLYKIMLIITAIISKINISRETDLNLLFNLASLPSK